VNFHCLLRRIVGRPTCLRAEHTQLASSARIINMSRLSSNIRLGAHSVVKGEMLVFAHGGRITFGEWCYLGEGSRVWSGAAITVGDRVLISHNVNIIDNLTHPMNARARHQHFRQIVERGHPRHIDLDDRPILIGNDVWIGTGTIVLRGVTIGDGAVIGAGSVVTRDIPPLSVAGGNPATVIRELIPNSDSADGSSSEVGLK